MRSGYLKLWMAHRDEIERPVYIASIANAIQELVKDKDFDYLDQSIEFCNWILTHPDTAQDKEQPRPRDEAREYPNWRSSRRAVVDFIDTCLNKDTEATITARKGLANLLNQVCTQFDWRLDQHHPVILNNDDQISEAINNTRSRALQSLIDFGYWVRRQLPKDVVPEATDIVDKRLGNDAEIPLTRPEYAILGLHFGNLCHFNPDWATKHRMILFPQANQSVWFEAFGSFVLFNRPVKQTFEILRKEYEFALQHLSNLVSAKDSGAKFANKPGQHLFFYYLWEAYPLTGDDSLLAIFYEKTNEDHKHWAHLYEYSTG